MAALTPHQSLMAAAQSPVAVMLSISAGIEYAKSVLREQFPETDPKTGWPDYPLSNFMQLVGDRAEEVVAILAGESPDA